MYASKHLSSFPLGTQLRKNHGRVEMVEYKTHNSNPLDHPPTWYMTGIPVDTEYIRCHYETRSNLIKKRMHNMLNKYEYLICQFSMYHRRFFIADTLIAIDSPVEHEPTHSLFCLRLPGAHCRQSLASGPKQPLQE